VKPVTRIVVLGQPAPQGSKRFMGLTPHGKPKMVEQNAARIRPWRDAVHAAAFETIRCCPDPDCGHLAAGYPLDEPLIARVVFTFTRPRSHYRSGRNAHLLRAEAPTYPAGRPDLSKLLRATEDALTDAGLWRDDARVVIYTRLAKVWVGEDPEALDSPGAVIEVMTAGRPIVPVTPPPAVPAGVGGGLW
jgi:crossover junction endodeoxyribonuclease RusA